MKQGIGSHLHMRWETRGSSRVVVGNSGFLSRYDWNLWAPFTCMKGVKPHLQFREGTRDCSLDAEGTNGLKSHGRGTHLVFLKLQWEGWDSSPGTTGNSGTTPVVSGNSSLQSSCEGECRVALESQQGNQASIRIEGGILRFFLSFDRRFGFPQVATGT